MVHSCRRLESINILVANMDTGRKTWCGAVAESLHVETTTVKQRVGEQGIVWGFESSKTTPVTHLLQKGHTY